MTDPDRLALSRAQKHFSPAGWKHPVVLLFDDMQNIVEGQVC